MKTFYMRSKVTNECFIVLAANQKAADTIVVNYLKVPELLKVVKNYFVTYKDTSFTSIGPRISTFVSLSESPNGEIEAVYSAAEKELQ